MAFLNLKFYSEALGMQTEVYVVIPQRQTSGEIGVSTKAEDRKYKCLYLLHGLSDDHSIWLRRTSIERYASEYGICVVMPAAAKSFYTDMKYGMKYYTYIARELPGVIREFLNVSDKREDNYIAGLSMGGYGALKIGLREGGTFCAAAGLSPVAELAYDEWHRELFVPIWGESNCVPQEDNLFCLVQAHNDDPDRPRLYIGIGTDDALYPGVQRLKAKLDALDYDFTYRESEGRAHSWDFWDEYIQYVLEWMLSSK